MFEGSLAFFCRLFGACFGDDVRDFLYVLSSSGIVGDFAGFSGILGSCSSNDERF